MMGDCTTCRSTRLSCYRDRVETVEGLLDVADTAMYASKRNGRCDVQLRRFAGTGPIQSCEANGIRLRPHGPAWA